MKISEHDENEKDDNDNHDENDSSYCYCCCYLHSLCEVVLHREHCSTSLVTHLTNMSIHEALKPKATVAESNSVVTHAEPKLCSNSYRTFTVTVNSCSSHANPSSTPTGFPKVAETLALTQKHLNNKRPCQPHHWSYRVTLPGLDQHGGLRY